jgi:hypothetical protein
VGEDEDASELVSLVSSHVREVTVVVHRRLILAELVHTLMVSNVRLITKNCMVKIVKVM